MGIGFGPVESQGQATALLLPTLDVVQGQQVPADLRRGRVDPQRLEPGRLGFIKSQQAIQGIAAAKMERDGHRRVPGTDPVEVIQRHLPGWRGAPFVRRGRWFRPLEDDLREQEVGGVIVGVRRQPRPDLRFGLVQPSVGGQPDRLVQRGARAETNARRPRPARRHPSANVSPVRTRRIIRSRAGRSVEFMADDPRRPQGQGRRPVPPARRSCESVLRGVGQDGLQAAGPTDLDALHPLGRPQADQDPAHHWPTRSYPLP